MAICVVIERLYKSAYGKKFLDHKTVLGNRERLYEHGDSIYERRGDVITNCGAEVKWVMRVNGGIRYYRLLHGTIVLWESTGGYGAADSDKWERDLGTAIQKTGKGRSLEEYLMSCRSLEEAVRFFRVFAGTWTA